MSRVMPSRFWVHACSSSASMRPSWVKTVLAGILRAQEDACSVSRMIYQVRSSLQFSLPPTLNFNDELPMLILK